MFYRAGRVEVLVDAPYFEVVAEVELDGGVVDVLGFELDGPAAVIAGPVGGTVEQQGADAVAAELATDDEVFDSSN